MGLFSSKKKIYVASSVYNLAGDVEDSVNYLKFTVGASVLTSSNNLAKDIVGGQINGPASGQNKFYKWANRAYTVSQFSASITGNALEDPTIIAPYINKAPEQRVWVQSAFVGSADPEYFAEDYLARNHPNLIDQEWSYDFNSETSTLTIDFANDSNNISVILSTYDDTKQYIYGRYVLVTDEDTSGIAIPYKTKENLISAEQIPLNDAYSKGDSTTEENIEVTLHHKVTTIIDYDKDERPRQETVDTSTSTGYADTEETTYYRSVYKGKFASASQTYTETTYLKVIKGYRVKTRVESTQTINEDGTEIQTVITETQYIEPIWSYTLSKKIELDEIMDGPFMFIYPVGSGNAQLDLVANKTELEPGFYPVLPIRWKNEFIDSDSLYDTYYEKVTKAYKKATNNSSFPDLLDQLKDNKNIDDIDYIYMMFGLSLNETDNASGRYIYQFLRDLIPYQNSSRSDFVISRTAANQKNNTGITWDRWNEAMGFTSEYYTNTNQPNQPTYSSPKTSSLELNNQSDILGDFRMKIAWAYIDEKVFAGRGKRGAKKGEVWMSSKPYDRKLGITGEDSTPGALLPAGSGRSAFFSAAFGDLARDGIIYIFYQIEDNLYKRLEIANLYHENHVYGGKTVTISGKEALDDDEPSGFIIPMHYPTLKKLSLVDQNQIATRNKILVMNSYKVVKIKWYQRGIFKAILSVIVVVGLSLIMGPGSLGVSSGLLGANAAVGASLGFAGGTMAAAIAGAAANTLAGMIVVSMLQDVAVKAFGEKWGSIVAALATFAVMNGGIQLTGPNAGISPVNWANMFRAENLIKLTDPIMQATQGYIRGEMSGMRADREAFMESYMDDMREIEELTRDNLGSNTGLSPIMATDAFRNGVYESSDVFLTRTLMTGSEVADLSTGMIDRFVDATLALKGPFD